MTQSDRAFSQFYLGKDRNYWHRVCWSLYIMLKVASFTDDFIVENASKSIKNFNFDDMPNASLEFNESRLQIYYGLIRIASKR